MGRQFMLNLLVRSLIADGGIEEAIMTVISDVEVNVSSSSSKEQPIAMDMAATPVLQLVQQLLNNLTIQQLTYFKQVKFNESQMHKLPLTISLCVHSFLMLQWVKKKNQMSYSWTDQLLSYC